MAQSTFSVRMDDALKADFDLMCSDFGMSMSTAITLFAKAVVRERKIPFDICSSNNRYFEDNLSHLQKALEEYKSGKIVAHDIIEAGNKN